MIMNRVMEEHLFQVQCIKSTEKANFLSTSRNEMRTTKFNEQIAYVLICEPLDNFHLGSSFLTLFIGILWESFEQKQITNTLADYYVKFPEDILGILHHLLPGEVKLYGKWAAIISEFKPG
ncbi:hypothetical protein IE077_002350 [Cardiosporidium cionae]|uniref:Uncharacterized protein n=1 Tax=Cardiosporidium cionae TaxID=476202 RepID=A0ABQ7JFR4_9APIC|nr:hypothetical protein IE077_002350 [Cardiosporidium cionae]|eukprot:KAF8822862.1 hypothetical protein IE077_002350 [Cardiosporidium cionae]